MATERSAPRWKTTDWRGHKNYECNGQVAGRPCEFKTLDRGAMLRHQARWHRDTDQLAGVLFASPQAEAAAREAGLGAADLGRQSPTGAEGAYTTADVKAAAKTTTTEG